MASVNDWAAKAAREIVDDVSEMVQWRNKRLVCPTEERIAAIIVLHAEPIIRLLQDARRSHHKSYLAEENDYAPCPKSYEDDDELSDELCTCGADAWNARIDEALKGP